MGILEVKNVGKRFGGLQALGDVNLSVAENSVHAIIGPNGAGKSTLLNVLVGKLIPDTGSVMFDGKSVLGLKPYEICQMGISRVFQTPEIFGDLSVMENMMIPCFAKRDGAFMPNGIATMMKDKEIIDQAEHMLEEMNMADKRGMHAASLSRGAPSSNTTCMWCFRWLNGSQYWHKARRWSKTRPTRSKATPKCAKRIWAKAKTPPNNGQGGRNVRLTAPNSVRRRCPPSLPRPARTTT